MLVFSITIVTVIVLMQECQLQCFGLESLGVQRFSGKSRLPQSSVFQDWNPGIQVRILELKIIAVMFSVETWLSEVTTLGFKVKTAMLG